MRLARSSELVERAARGERIGITKRGKLRAVLGPAQEEVDLKKVFARMDEIRKRSKKPKNVSVKDLIEEEGEPLRPGCFRGARLGS
jgi:prevent-host-death family protein